MTKLQQLPKLIRLLLRLQDMSALPDARIMPDDGKCFCQHTHCPVNVGLLRIGEMPCSVLFTASGRRTFCTTWSIN